MNIFISGGAGFIGSHLLCLGYLFLFSIGLRAAL
jgi:hypothetical protein